MARTADPFRRSDILEAARSVFAEKGFTNARMSDIAERANIASGTVYLYFKSKEALVSALSQEFQDKILAKIMPLLSEFDSETGLGKIISIIFDISVDNLDLLKLLYLDLGLAKEQHQPVILAPADFETITQTIRYFMDTNQIVRYESPETLTILLANLMRWIVGLFITVPVKDREVIEKTVKQMLIRMLIPNPS
jgi:AcrR family transcriptional regulator